MVDVLAVGSGVGEPLEALGALERLLTSVGADVELQVGLSGEGFITLFTFK